MTEILFLVVGIALGVGAGVAVMRGKQGAADARRNALADENETLKATVADRDRDIKALTDERTQLISQRDVITAQAESARKEAERTIQTIKEDAEKQIERERNFALEKMKTADDAFEKERQQAVTLRQESDRQWSEKLNMMRQELEKAATEIQTVKEEAGKQIVRERNVADERMQKADEALEKERLHAAKLREESDKQWAEKLERLRQELQKTAVEMLNARQEALQDTNRTQMGELLKPIKEQFEAFKRSVDESKTSNEVSKKDLQKTFEDTMTLFERQQKMTIDTLREQTEKIGSDAANLTKALKGESKTQGDWGEMVLDTLLEQSGLRKGEEYFVQENVKDEDNNNLRPDVIVRFPEGRSVVIDSKVSLTAYADAVAATDDAERERLLKEHARSVRKHVDELAQKSYDRIVADAIGFVLMFIPNESSYIAAMKQQPDLSRYAYKNRIIIISPSNLLMALQLAYNLWQYDRQTKNVETIVKTAADLYDKVAGFSETFADIEMHIERLNKAYATAKGQMYDGRGNIMRRMESLKVLGVTPKKQIKGIEGED